METPIPEKINLTYKEGDLIITRKWFGFQYLALAFFCIFWDGFLVFWYAKAFESTSSMDLIMILFPLGHVAVGVGLTYTVIAGFFNTTEIRVGQGRIKIKHRPVPWFGNKTVQAHQLTQLFPKRKISRSNNGTNVSYAVYMVTQDNRQKVLLSGLENIDQANFIEEKIEGALGIKDRRIRGEIQD